MVRTAFRGGLAPQDPNRRRDKRPTVQQFVNHPEYKKRLAIDRNFILERGIAVEEFRGTGVPEVVESRGWTGYVRRPRNANLSLVKEFYANLQDAQFGTHGVVLVRGVPVIVTAEMINAYYDLPPIQQVINSWPTKSESGRVIRHDQGVGWNGVKTTRAALTTDCAFWNLFISASLKPTTHTGEIFKEPSQILYAIKTGRYFDVAGCIKKEIRGCARQLDTNMIFPCLITAMCASAGIEVDDSVRDDTSQPDQPLSLITWNGLVCSRTLPQIGEQPRRKKRRDRTKPDQQDREHIFQDPADQMAGDFMQGPPSESGAGSSEQRPEWVEYMLSTMRGYVDQSVAGLRTDMYARFDSMQLSIDEIRRATVHPPQQFDPSVSQPPGYYDQHGMFVPAHPGGSGFEPSSSRQPDEHDQ